MTQRRKKYWYLFFLALPVATLIVGLMLQPEEQPALTDGFDPSVPAPLYLQQALVAVLNGDRLEAIHEVDHFMFFARERDAARAEVIMTLLEEENLEQAAEQLVSMIGPSAAFLTTITADTVEHGREVFVNNGCGACHGENAEGTDIAPALPGHTIEQVKRQVRAPVGNMPVFTNEQISNSELDALTAYIVTLQGSHVHPGVDVRDQMMRHYWLFFGAIAEGDIDEAIHHIEKVGTFVSGQHLDRVEEILATLEAGDVDTAVMLVGNALAGVDPPNEPRSDLYLRQTLAALNNRDIEEAIFEINNFIELSSGQQRADGETVRDLLENDLLEDASIILTNMLR
ncbi:MAG: cytochrome c [Chloroflexi bacterium]|nr:MAG: cytochrome c [Chloroflexota bacterium]